MSRRSRVASTGAAVGILVIVLLGGATSGAVGGPPKPGDSMLGLPSLTSAQRYVLAPSSRTVRPTRVVGATAFNDDYVSAASRTSEVSAHGLREGTSDVATVAGVHVRRAGVGKAGGWFSYQFRVAPHRAFTLRVEEAGSSKASYDVLVNGTLVHTRKLALYAAQGRPIGQTHYSVVVPARLVDGPEVTVTFQNSADPGDGARVAGVWANGDHQVDDDQYGGTVTAPAAAARKGTTTLDADFFGRPYVIYDFGREVGGTVSLDVDHLGGNPEIGLAFSESDTFLTTYSDFSQDPSGIATETHYFKPAGSGPLDDPVIRGGFRYLMVFLDTPGSVQLSDLRLHFTADPKNPHPADYVGAFLSSDDTLNRLWYAGAYTTQMSTIASDTGRPYPATPGPVHNDVTVAQGDEFLSDGAKRDRLDWGGDNGVSDVVSYLTTAQSEPAQNSLEWFAAHPSSAGQVPGVYLPPPTGFNFGWGEYAAWWMQNYWNHYLYTGDRDFLQRWFSVLQGNVAWVESSVGADGLWNVPGDAGGHWGYGQSGKETYDNLVYVQTLGYAADAAEALGHTDLATTWRGYAKRTGDAVNNQLWDDDAGAYRTLPGATSHPLDANAIAVASGVAGPARAARVLDFIDAHLQTPYGDIGTDTTQGNAVPDYISPFVAGLELHAYGRAGDTAGAMDVLRRTWTHMLRGDTSGTFWETVSPDGGLGLGSYTSMSHGWAASPTSFLTEYTLGVTPTTAGYATFDVSPHPAHGLDWAQGAVPTPHGTIRTAWRRQQGALHLVVEAPAGTSYTATVPVPTGATVQVSGGRAAPVVHDGTATVSGLSGSTTITIEKRG